MRLPHLPAITLFYAATLSAAPAITGVYNAASWLPPGLPNSGVSQGAVFTVTGTGLGPSALLQAQSYPLPTTQGLGGTTVTVTIGSVTKTCIMAYTYALQVAAVLPSTTPIGTGIITVTYQGASTTAPIQVVAAVFGQSALNEGGTGPGVVTDTSYNVITMINAAHAGDTVILWGTGLGATGGDETEPPPNVNIPGVKVWIENIPAAVAYAGRSSSPGLDQINITIPSGIGGGCKTSILVSVNGAVGNVVSMAVAPAGQKTCGDTFGALTSTNLSKAIGSGSLNLGVVDLTRVGSTSDDYLNANFSTYPTNTLIRSYAGSLGPSIGSCIDYEQVDGTTLTIIDPVLNSLSNLDSGPTLTVTPANAKTFTVRDTVPGVYSAIVGEPSQVFLAPVSYTLAKGGGGSQVPTFNWSATLPSAIAFTNLPITVNRSADLTLNWTNSSSFSLVSIFGFAAVPISSTVNSYVEFICTAPASATQFTIPAAILSLLPTNGFGAQGVAGVNFQIAGVLTNRFTVAGNPGLDAGIWNMFTSNGTVVNIQ